MEENDEEKLVSTGDPQNASVTDPNLTTAKECTATVGSSLSLTSPEVSLTHEVEHQLPDLPLAPVGENYIVPVSRPAQEQSTGEMNNTMFSMPWNAANTQWQILRKESEELSVKLTAFMSRLSCVSESCLPTALSNTTDNEEAGDAAARTTAENVEMQTTAIKEAVQTFQKFHVWFNEMDDKMKQWVPAIDAAKANEDERLLIKQQAEKIEQELRNQLNEKKAENKQLQKDYEERLKKKDDDLAKLQENLTWKVDAEEHKKLLNKYRQEAEENRQEAEKYKQEAEEYKRKFVNSETISQRLEQESKDYQDTIEQNKVIIQQLQESKATNERTITNQNGLIKTKGDELEAQKNQNNSIIAKVKRLEEDAKQKELEHYKQKLQQELNIKKIESQKQMEHSVENVRAQKEIEEQHSKSEYWKGKYEGLHECVSTISDMGKTAMRKMPQIVATSTPLTITSPNSTEQQEETPTSTE